MAIFCANCSARLADFDSKCARCEETREAREVMKDVKVLIESQNKILERIANNLSRNSKQDEGPFLD